MHDHDHKHLERLPDALARRVQGELGRDEHLLWVGQPRPDLFAQGSIFLVFFGLFFLGFSALWMVIPLSMGLIALGGAAIGDNPGAGVCGMPFLCFGLFGVPFILIGGYMATAPFWQRRLARRSCYALTNKRAVTFQAGFFGRMTTRSYHPDVLKNMIRVENADGSGNLVFQEALVSTGRRVATRQYGFMCIDDVARVEELIRDHLLRAP